MSAPTPQLLDEIYRSKVARARLESPGNKALAGPELFDSACEWMTVGIRGQFPHFSEEEVRAERLRRIDLSRRLENRRHVEI